MLYRVTCLNKYRGLAPAVFGDADDVAQYIIESADEADAEEGFDLMLNDVEPWVTVCGMDYLPSEVLRKCDPIAYRCAVGDFLDSFYQDIVYDLDRNDGEYSNQNDWFGFAVEMVKDEKQMQAAS